MIKGKYDLVSGSDMSPLRCITLAEDVDVFISHDMFKRTCKLVRRSTSPQANNLEVVGLVKVEI